METILGNDYQHKNGSADNHLLINPNDTDALHYQVAGHSRVGLTVLKHKDGFIMKPLQSNSRGARECDFYAQINNNSASRPLRIQNLLNHLTPSYLGVSYLLDHNTNNIDSSNSNGEERQKFLMLQDIVQGLKKPCVIDIKIGAQTWGPNATPDKIISEKKKYVGTKESLGLSVAGMYYYDLSSKNYVRKERHFGRELNHETLHDALLNFLNFPTHSSNIVLELLLAQLSLVQELFESQAEFLFFSSSLLIAYDAELLEGNAAQNLNANLEPLQNQSLSPVRVFMIDFAHVFPMDKNGRDENYLHGLYNVIKIFKKIYEKRNSNN